MLNTPLMYFILGLIFIALGIPLLQRKVPRNWWYGFRTRKTLASDAVWYAANQIAGRDLVVAGTFVAVSSLVLMELTRVVASNILTLINVVVFALATLGATAHSLRAIKKL